MYISFCLCSNFKCETIGLEVIHCNGKKYIRGKNITAPKLNIEMKYSSNVCMENLTTTQKMH